MTAMLLDAVHPIIQIWPFMLLMCFMYFCVGAVMSWLLSSLPIRKRGFIILMVALMTLVGVMNGSIGFLMHSASSIFVGLLFAACFGATLPLALPRGARNARAKYLLGQTNIRGAITAFDRLKQPGSEFITEDSLVALLKSADTTDSDRRTISWLSDNIRTIGHKAGEYKKFHISVEGAGEQMIDIYVINREDLASSEARLLADSNGWLRTAPV